MARPDPQRRRFLAVAGSGVLMTAVWPLVNGLAGCSGGQQEDPGEATLTLPLVGLPESVRVRQMLDGKPVEIRRTGDQVVARSLLCTHQGCEVRWEAEHGRYFCPCHDGTFDADGRVLGGPATRPLRTYPVRIQDRMVIVGP